VGFACKTVAIDLQVGGFWQFDMTGPDGTVFPNLHRYTLFEAPVDGAGRIEFTMFGEDSTQPHSWVVVTLTPEGEGTRLVQRMTFPTRDCYETAVGFGAVELGKTTMAKLAALAESL
jgi:uncharacterized protein YndB with AHSA1/START domain